MLAADSINDFFIQKFDLRFHYVANNLVNYFL